ncbi:MAG: urea carboxylase-associated family protein [Alphaproteobacteria bacterium]|nr:urea carboxylase-associated family protein [Alphaproteobacteria bacterium]
MARSTTSIEIPGYGNGFVVAGKGTIVRLTDLKGNQVGDLWAIAAKDHDEYLSTATTRMLSGRMFPRLGEPFFTTRDRPILTFVKDTSPGFHDMMFASCCDALYRKRGAKGHPNCRDNYFAAIARAGVRHANIPDPVNIFQNTPARPDGSFLYGVTMSAPGDHVEFRVEMDCMVIVTACSSERINAGASTPMRLEVRKSVA